MEIDGDFREKKTTRKQIFDFLSTVKDEKLKEQFSSDEKSFKSLDTVLKDYFESKQCIDIDCKKEELKWRFRLFSRGRIFTDCYLPIRIYEITNFRRS